MSEWESAWVTKKELEILISLFLYDRGDMGGTDEEMEKIYEWAEETRMSQYLMDCCLDGLLIPTIQTDYSKNIIQQLSFKITDKGEKVALEALKGDMENPQHRFIATKVLEAETGLSLTLDKRKDKGNGNGNGNGNGKE